MTLWISFNAQQRENSEAQVFLESVGSAVNTSSPLIKASKTSLYSRLRSWGPDFIVARRRAKTISCRSNGNVIHRHFAVSHLNKSNGMRACIPGRIRGPFTGPPPRAHSIKRGGVWERDYSRRRNVLTHPLFCRV